MKTIPYLLFLFLLSCSLLISCDNEQDDYISKYCPGSCTVIKGRLTTANGARPLAHVPLVVNWYNDGYIVSGATHKKAVGQTDADGTYELRFLIKDDEFEEGYFVVEPALDASRYVYCHSGAIDFPFSYLKRDTTFSGNYEIPEKASIEFKLSNPDALQAGDRFTVELAYLFGIDGQQLCGTHIQWQETYKNNQTAVVAADQALVLELVKLKNGTEIKEQVVVQLQPGETKVMSLNF